MQENSCSVQKSRFPATGLRGNGGRVENVILDYKVWYVYFISVLRVHEEMRSVVVCHASLAAKLPQGVVAK